MKNMENMMKQAQKMQAKLLEVQNELANKTIETSVGGGMIKVIANGAKKIISVNIEQEVVNPDDIEMLQDLIVAAINDALNKAEKMSSQEMGKITGGLKIPGII